MSKGLKIFLIVMLSICGAGVVILGAGTLWLKTKIPDLKEWGDEVVREAKEYGRGRTSRNCLDEAMRRSERCLSFNIKCGVRNSLFLRYCLDSGRRTAGFCRDVPEKNEILKTATWRVAVCKKHYKKVDPNICGSILMAVQEHCHPRRRSKTAISRSDAVP